MVDPSQFSEFFEAVHGQTPFAWQARLAEQVCGGGGWPEILDIPTGAGKTAVIDIALFHLACAANGGQGTVPRRIAFVVDRRLVVDDAYRRAQLLAARLIKPDAETSILGRVAKALKDLANPDDDCLTEEPPLAVARLRGGMPLEGDWARTPCQPTILVSTVDQVGSRLLFRGYGVSPGMRPIHAGLLGSGALVFLDEAHLSQPFAQSFTALMNASGKDRSDRTRLVTLSATPGRAAAGSAIFPKTDRKDMVWGDRKLSDRLEKPKTARLMKAKTKSDSERAYAEAIAEAAWSLSALGDGPDSVRVVAAVVNRVALARAVYRALVKKAADCEAEADAALLIGRARDVDRLALMNEFLPRMKSNTNRPADGKFLFVAATQSIEAGADLDFDAMVTQIAPLDCLTQRFGRLNRLGRFDEAQAIVIAASDEVRKTAKDFIYGTAPAATWAWLNDGAPKAGKGFEGQRDVSPKAMRDRQDAAAEEKAIAHLMAEKAAAPVLMPAYLDLWSQTNPAPAVDPDPALFLHGADAGPEDVQIVWRADIPEPKKNGGSITEPLSHAPPVAAEAVSVPLSAARRWLRRRDQGEWIADVEGTAGEEDRDAGSPTGPVWRQNRREGRFEFAWPNQIRPGDLIVVPSEYGGCDAWGWNPKGEGPTPDRFEKAQLLSRRGGFVFRLHRELLRQALAENHDDDPVPPTEPLWSRITEILEANREDLDTKRICRELAEIEDLPEPWRCCLEELAGLNAKLAFPYASEGDPAPASSGAVLQVKRIGSKARKAIRGYLFGEDDQPDDIFLERVADSATEREGSFQPKAVALKKHSGHVARAAESYAKGLGLDDHLVRDITLAAYLHDTGKADPRFQALLAGDEPVFAAFAGSKALLAKSPKRQGQHRGQHRARRGLVANWRHEVMSVRLIENHPALKRAYDPELVLYLIGSHHGYGRPLFPADDDAPPDAITLPDGLGGRCAVAKNSPARISSGWVSRFHKLRACYGSHRLALLEAILRLADHRASEAEQDKAAENLPSRTMPDDTVKSEKAVPEAWAAKTSLPLAGLEYWNLLAVMTLLGLLRSLDRAAPEWRARAAWDVAAGTPVLHLAADASEDEVAEQASEGCMHLAEVHDFGEFKDINFGPGKAKTFLMAAIRAKAIGAKADPERARLMAALFSDAAVKPSGDVEATALCTMFGQGHQHFLERLALVPRQAEIKGSDGAAKIREALFAPWLYSDATFGFRWDPNEDRRHAYRYKEPSKDKTLVVHGANRLAAVVLPLFTTVPVSDQGRARLATTGFRRIGREVHAVWPLWTEPADLDTILALLRHPLLTAAQYDKDRVAHLAIATIMQAQRISVGKYASFTGAEAV